MLDTPTGLRIQIGIFGRRNCGKSTLINALVGQSVAQGVLERTVECFPAARKAYRRASKSAGS